MRRLNLLLFPALFLLVAVLAGTSGILQRFSSQATVDPKTITSQFDATATGAVFNNRWLAFPYATEEYAYQVLGETSEPKRIEVDLTNQRLYAYEGDRRVFNFLISSGKWGKTPTGDFRIWTKLRYTKMEGGSKVLRTYYYLPNVPFVMYFYNDEIPKWRGFGLHGTYWHSNFGHPMSHGCINMRTEDAGQLYYWAQPDLRGRGSILAGDDNPGTPVVIYGEAPVM
jgi:lipoprotein-anchoring transpeptidase ErfK/SrfK